MGFSPVPAPAGMRTKLPVDAGTFLQGFDSFVLLHLYFWGGIQLGAEWNYKHRNLWEWWKPQARWEARGSCPRDCVLGQGREFPRHCQTFVLCKEKANSQKLHQEMPLCQHDKAKEPTKDSEVLTVTTPGKKKLNFFIPGMGRHPQESSGSDQSDSRTIFDCNSAFLEFHSILKEEAEECRAGWVRDGALEHFGETWVPFHFRNLHHYHLLILCSISNDNTIHIFELIPFSL